MKSQVRLLCLSLCLGSAAALLGCGSDDSPAALVASARKHLQQHERSAALIQLKNALQKDPNLAEARLLLGRSLLDGGDPVTAAVELGKALDLGGAAAEAVPLLARALLIQGKAREVVERFGETRLAPPSAQAALLVVLAQAQFMQDRRDGGLRALDAALALDPANVDAQLTRLRLQLAEQGPEAVLPRLQALLQQQPSAQEAWLLKGQLLTQQDPQAALAAFRQALQIQPDLIAAHAGVISVLLAQHKTSEAATQLAQLKKAHPQRVQTRVLETAVVLQQGDVKQARNTVQQLLKVLPDEPVVLELAGLVEYQAGALVQASSYFGKQVALLPEAASVGPRRLLALTHLRAGDPAKALETLQPLLAAKLADSVTLALAAQAYQQQGALEQAERLYQQASTLDPADVRSRTALAVLQFGRGQNAALDTLQSLAASDPGATADLALVNARMRQRDYAQALQAIDALEKKTAGQPLAPMLRARAQLALQQPARARESLEQALRADAVYMPAVLALASLDVQDKQFDAARQRFDAVLKSDPRNLQALLAVARIRSAAGAPVAEVTKLLEEAVRLNPAQGVARVALVEHHLAHKNAEAALAAAREAVAALPDDAGLLGVMAQAQAATGDLNQSLGTLNRLSSLKPNSVQAQLMQAELHLAAQNVDGALASLRRAVALAPREVGLKQRLAMTLLKVGRPDQALTVAREMQKQPAQQVAGFLVEGDIQAHQKHWPEAAAALRAALQKQPSGAVAVKLHMALLSSDRREAAAFAQRWSAQRPADTFFVQHLAEVALAQNDKAQAEAQYLALTRLLPEDPTVLNNLAWVQLLLGKPQALAHAEKANRLRPDSPPLMDTWAKALGQQGQWQRAIELEKKAIALDKGQTPTLRLNLVRLYLQAGQRDQARTELDALTRLGAEFKGQAEVAQLQQQL